MAPAESDDPIKLSKILSHFDEPYLPKGMHGSTHAFAFDASRVQILTNLLRKGHAERVDDENGVPHVVFTLDTLGHGISREDPRAVENYFRGMLPWRDVLTREGRWERKVVRSLRAEWRDTGRIRVSLFPDLA